VGALAGGVVGDAGFFGEGGHLDVPAGLEFVVEVAHPEVSLFVGDVEVVEGGDVGAPLGELGLRDLGGAFVCADSSGSSVFG
jgi:hypothetical protein